MENNKGTETCLVVFLTRDSFRQEALWKQNLPQPQKGSWIFFLAFIGLYGSNVVKHVYDFSTLFPGGRTMIWPTASPTPFMNLNMNKKKSQIQGLNLRCPSGIS